LQAITDIRVTYFFEPDAMVLNPTDWTTIRLAKDANGQYLGGSFFGTNYGIGANSGNVGIEDRSAAVGQAGRFDSRSAAGTSDGW
jgi:hypothetical protein